MLSIADVSLIVANDDVLVLAESNEDHDDNNIMSPIRKFQVREGVSAVDLECSFRLARHPEKLELRLQFVFNSVHSNVEKMVWCNESNQITDNWVVTPNMDDNTCHLKIVNFSKADGGQYNCIMAKINSHTAHSEDKSNTVILAAESTLKPSKKQNSKNDFGQFGTGVFYGVLSLTIVIVVAFSTIVVVRVKSWCNSRVPRPVPPDQHAQNDPIPGSYMLVL